MSAHLSGSGLGRAKACPVAYALPQVRRDSEDAARGRVVHQFLAEVVSGRLSSSVALELVPQEHKKLCAAIPMDGLPRGRCEVALAYDVRTGRVRELGVIDRSYRVHEHEVPGTVDLVVDRDGLPPLVIDWKTGHSVDPEEHRAQLEFYGLCVARLHGEDEVDVHLGAVGDDGAIAWTRWHLDLDTLVRIASDVRETWQKVQLARMDRSDHEAQNAAPWMPDVTVGPHCRWCPAWEACPAKRAALLTVLNEKTIDDIGKAYAVAKDAEQWIENIRVATKEAVEMRGSLATPDGRIVKKDSRGHLRFARA